MSVLWKIKSKKINRINLIKSFKGKGYEYRNFIEFSEELEKKGYRHFPICMAKTQYSFSTDPNLLGAPTGLSLIHI